MHWIWNALSTRDFDRYAGPTEFATGLWAGVELESPQGKNNGTVKGVVYFRCSKNYGEEFVVMMSHLKININSCIGTFIPLNRLTKIRTTPTRGRERERTRQPRSSSATRRDSSSGRRSLSLPPGRINHGRVDVSKIQSRVAQGKKMYLARQESIQTEFF